MSKITVTLSAANMGPNATENDFDAWAAYVNEHIEFSLGLGSVTVDQFGFTGRTSATEDQIDGATDEQADDITDYLDGWGWDAFCSDMGTRVAA